MSELQSDSSLDTNQAIFFEYMMSSLLIQTSAGLTSFASPMSSGSCPEERMCLLLPDPLLACLAPTSTQLHSCLLPVEPSGSSGWVFIDLGYLSMRTHIQDIRLKIPVYQHIEVMNHLPDSTGIHSCSQSADINSLLQQQSLALLTLGSSVINCS